MHRFGILQVLNVVYALECIVQVLVQLDVRIFGGRAVARTDAPTVFASAASMFPRMTHVPGVFYTRLP